MRGYLEKENVNPANIFDMTESEESSGSTDSLETPDSLNALNPLNPFNDSDIDNSSIDNTELIQKKADEEFSNGKDTENTGPEISRVRERTFNKELSDLVSRIKSNEPGKDEIPASVPPKKEITEDDLLQMYHQLFYKAVNISGIEKIDTSFNPFILYKELSSDDLLTLIYNEMTALSFNEYAILAYNPEKNYYSCYTNNIPGLDERNIVIDPSENLYANIINNKHGNILDRQSIERDIYYKKRFSAKNSLLFISFGNLFIDYYSNADLRNVNDFSDAFFPILLIRMEENPGENRKKTIYREIESKLIVYFFLLYRKLTIDKQSICSAGLQSIYGFLDYIFQKYNKQKDCICAVIKSKKYINAESLLILKFMYGKLKNKLSGSAEILRIEKDKLLIFTRKQDRKRMDDILDEFNKTYSDLFRVDTFSDDGIKTAGSTSRNIKEYLIK
jgi:hypothetical protein